MNSFIDSRAVVMAVLLACAAGCSDEPGTSEHSSQGVVETSSTRAQAPAPEAASANQSPVPEDGSDDFEQGLEEIEEANESDFPFDWEFSELWPETVREHVGEAVLTESWEDGSPKLRREVLGDGPGFVNHGSFQRWNAEGKLIEEGTFMNGLPEGAHVVWYEDGLQKRREGAFAAGLRVGRWSFWQQNGELVAKNSGLYEQGRKVSD